MEIEVGEYVRTEDGRIGKVLIFYGKDECYKKMNNYSVDTIDGSVYEEDIKAHSKNIIDLIEVNDIIVTKHPAFEKIYYEHIWSDEYLKHIKDYLNEKSLILLQILTHEQFEQNCYRLEEK